MKAENQAHFGMSSSEDAPLVDSGATVPAKKPESQKLKSQERFNSVLSKFGDLNLDENSEHVRERQKVEMIISLVNQIKDLEKRVDEKKQWAHEKVTQAAKKLNSDLTELRTLRMEKEEMQQINKGKQTISDSTMKRMSKVEIALRNATEQLNLANAAVKRLETENAKIIAEIEASKLAASESMITYMETTKKGKNCRKKLLAWKKLKAKLQEEIADETEKIKELHQCLARMERDQKEIESKLREELNAKRLALAVVQEKQCSKEEAEVRNKGKLDALRTKIELDIQRHRDDQQRLEQEISRLKQSEETIEFDHQTNSLFSRKSEGKKPQGEAIARLLQVLAKLDDSSAKEVTCNRECIVCSKNDASILVLPCAHQVLCANCNDSFGKRSKASCPYCGVPIELRIRVFGS